jgi:hypothetical protein
MARLTITDLYIFQPKSEWGLSIFRPDRFALGTFLMSIDGSISDVAIGYRSLPPFQAKSFPPIIVTQIVPIAASHSGNKSGGAIEGCNVPEIVGQHAVTFSALFWGKRGATKQASVVTATKAFSCRSLNKMQITPRDPVFLRLPREVLGPRAVPQPSLTGG